MGSYSVVQGIRCLMGQPLHCSAANGGVWRERLWWWLKPLRVTQPYPLLPWLPGFPSQACLTTISSLLSPQSIHLSVVNSNPYAGCSTVPRLHLPAAEPSRGPATLSGVCTAAARAVILIPFRLPQIHCLTLSLKCFSSDSGNCPDVEIGPLLQFPLPPRAGPVLTLLFLPLVPSSYRVLCGSIYSFPLVRYSCPLSAGVLCALLCLRCVPDVSVERDVLHVHPFLCRLILLLWPSYFKLHLPQLPSPTNTFLTAHPTLLLPMALINF